MKMIPKHEGTQWAALRLRPAGSVSALQGIGERAIKGSVGPAGRLRENSCKKEMDKAEACRMYAKKAGMDLKGQNFLAEGRIRAERKAGEWLKDNVKRATWKRIVTGGVQYFARRHNP